MAIHEDSASNLSVLPTFCSSASIRILTVLLALCLSAPGESRGAEVSAFRPTEISPAAWTKIMHVIDDDRYGIVADQGSPADYSGKNLRQGFAVDFSSGGLRMMPARMGSRNRRDHGLTSINWPVPLPSPTTFSPLGVGLQRWEAVQVRGWHICFATLHAQAMTRP